MCIRDRLEPYAELIRDEVNVRAVTTSQDVGAFASFDLRLDARTLGPRLGKRMKPVMTAAKSGQWKSLDGGRVEVDGEVLEPGDGFQLVIVPTAGESRAVAGLGSGDGVVVLDTALTEDLLAEGRARDFVRLVQQERKRAGLEVSDRVHVSFQGSEALALALSSYGDYVATQVLADELDGTASLAGDPVGEIDEQPVRIEVAKSCLLYTSPSPRDS